MLTEPHFGTFESWKHYREYWSDMENAFEKKQALIQELLKESRSQN